MRCFVKRVSAEQDIGDNVPKILDACFKYANALRDGENGSARERLKYLADELFILSWNR